MALCETCKTIPFGNLPAFPEWLPSFHLPLRDRDLVPYLPDRDKLTWKEDGLILGLPHHKSLEALEVAAQSCIICQLIHIGVTKVQELLATAAENDWWTFEEPSGGPNFELFICKQQYREDGFVVLSPASKNYEVYLMGAIGYCVDYDSTSTDKVRGRVVPTDPASPEVLGQLRTWMNTCEKEHDHGRQMETELPLRVLDVGDSALGKDKIKLYEPKGMLGRYAVLSHCWGDSRQFTTTVSTLAGRKIGIELADIPRTFQDAVTITRALGLRYLWLDSLCICQDDDKDWERQSFRMSEVYSNAYISLSAMRSANDMEGFLTARPERKYAPLNIPLNDGTPGAVLAFAIPPAFAAHGSRYVKMGREPLSKRAWALQERYLPRRILHFASTQISFECDTHFQTEDGFLDKEGRMFNLEEEKEVGHTIFDIKYRGSGLWRSIVNHYTRRNLTRPSDKLPALSGLVRAFHRVLGRAGDPADNYVAGLWRDNLVEELCWQSPGGSGERLPAYRAPSWSWVSIDGWTPISSLGNMEDIVEVLEASATVPGENPLGEVVSGYLKIRAPIVRLLKSKEPEHDFEKNPPERNVRLVVEGYDENMHGNYASFDVKSEVDREKLDDMSLFAVPMAWEHGKDRKTGEGTKYAYSLIVNPSENPGSGFAQDGTRCYRRLGYIFLSETKLIEKWITEKEQGTLPVHTLI